MTTAGAAVGTYDFVVDNFSSTESTTDDVVPSSG